MARLASLAIALAMPALAGCHSPEFVAPHATVYYVLVAPLCSSRIAVQFSIDAVPVGTDTFAVNLPPYHTTSRGFTTSAGRHRIGARTLPPLGVVWSDTLVDLASGDVFTDSLPAYCS